jgi:TatD DNase family protein
VEIAQRRRLPVIIHSREAWDDTVGIVEDALRADPSWTGRPGADPAARGVFHCFPGDDGMARRVIGLGFYISFPGPITFPDKPTRPNLMAEVARTAPLGRVLIETDSPYLTPHPHRGKRNEPANVAMVAGRLAALRGLPVEQIARATSANAANLFGLTVPA